jgi:aspartyl-tRNA(Asn)/glutamyl-tRNA(Gln) amidotransferase subunit A
MENTELAYLSGTEQLRLFSAGSVSPVEVLKAQIARVELVEPHINAFSKTLFESALISALAAEQRYREGRQRPLEGLTLGVKETMAVQGTTTTHGSLIHRDDPPAKYSHPWVERLQNAGAIVHARTTSPEFACAWVTTSRLNGVTRNPWDLSLTCGASSGGSAASLAAGTSTLATGTDIGGSIRYPAAQCGVVGYMPPHGRNPDVAPNNLDSYDHVGPLARTVSDCALMQNVGSGPHLHDLAALQERLHIPTHHSGIEGWRIAWTMNCGNSVVDPEVAAGFRTALMQLEAAGAILEEVELGWGEEVTEAACAHLDYVSGQSLVRAWHDHPDLVCDYTAWYAQRAANSTQDRSLWAKDVATNMYLTLEPMLERFQALVCPAFVTQKIRADAMPWETIQVAGQTFDCDYQPSLLHPFNMFGHLPVVAMPCGLGDNGLPIGVQIVTRAYDDIQAFRIASAMEQQRQWLDIPARRPAIYISK